jgi:hypothetical protein
LIVGGGYRNLRQQSGVLYRIVESKLEHHADSEQPDDRVEYHRSREPPEL